MVISAVKKKGRLECGKSVRYHIVASASVSIALHYIYIEPIVFGPLTIGYIH